MNQRVLGFLVYISIVTFGYVGTASSAPILDQDSGVDPTSSTLTWAGIGGGSIRGQSFTVGMDGILDSIEILISVSEDPGDALPLDLKLLSGETFFTEPSVAAAEIPLASMSTEPNWVRVDLSSIGLAVSTGEIFTIWLATYSDELSHVQWYGDFLDPVGPYSEGRSFIGPTGFANPTLDWGFRTYVVPEPATVLLLSTGLVGLAGFRTRSKK